jgi:penicillin amidase
MADIEARNQAPAPHATPRARRRKRRWPRILLWLACGLLILLLLAAGAGVLWLRSAAIAALPVLDGDVHLAGLSAPVTVRRDAHGVPHIEAETEDDLFTAQGYVTAQDRLWQMDTYRRNANGELAEVMGLSMVAHDRAQRVLQFRNTAQRVYANLSPEDRARFEAYARGVNLYIEQHQDILPPEFRLLHYHPQPWRGVDSISIGLMMVDMLDSHWYTKLAREHVAARLNNAKLESELYPVGSWRDHPPTGIRIDLSQPHPELLQPTDDDDDDDRSQASNTPAPASKNGVDLKGHGFTSRKTTRFGPLNVSGHDLSRAINSTKQRRALAPGGNSSVDTEEALGAPSLRFVSGARVGNHEPQRSTVHDFEDTRDLQAVLGQPSCNGCASGSNNWVISGQHTASGKPLLSNDMHLALTEPNIWYMADLKASSFHAAGVTLPGVPFVIAGHNEHVAWGFTALYADVQDLYLEALDGKGNYQDNDTDWKPLKVDHEVIKVRAGKDVIVDVQLTDHGPLLNPIFKKEKRPIALKWTLYDPALNGLPLYQMNVASNWTEFSAALETWCWPTQNVVYSDDQGHTAYHAIGKVPIPFLGNLVPFHHENLNSRQGTNEWTNSALVPGTYLPFDLMPHAFDPSSGFLATANSRVTADNAPVPLTHEWVDPYRIERIYKMLDGRDHLTPADLLAVQTDVYSEVDQELGHRFAYAIDHTPGADAQLQKAADLMRSWDGKLTTDSAAASIVTQARYAFWPLILKPKLGEDAAFYQWSESNFAEEEIIMHGNSEWLPASYKNWDELLTDAVRQGMKNKKAPADVTRWSYGSWHKVDIEHPLAQFLPLVGRVAGTGEQPLSGDTTTVKQVGREFGPSQRFTMDWSNIDGSTEDIVLGESGDPYSPYFRDQWNDYYAGTTFALPFTPAAVTAATQHTLRLLP